MKLQLILEKADSKNKDEVGDVAAFAFHGVRQALLENQHPVSLAADAKMFAEHWVKGAIMVVTARDLEMKEGRGLLNIAGVGVWSIATTMFGVTMASPLGVFVMPTYRKQGLMTQITDFGVKSLSTFKVQFAVVSCKIDSPSHKFLAEKRGVKFPYVMGYRDLRKPNG